MLSESARTAIDTLGKLGWAVQVANELHPLPKIINDRYPAIPPSVREFFEASDCIVFDRSWGEVGRFGSTVTISGLDWSGSTAVLHWAKGHKKHHVRSFRWRRSMG